MPRSIHAIGFVLLVVSMAATAVETAAADEPIDYMKDVKPILSARCFACHGSLKAESSLRLDTAAAAIEGGESGPAVVPGKPEQSGLLERISAMDESRMPMQGEALSNREIGILRRWIEQGARAPKDERPQPSPAEHWAFQPPRRHQTPPVESRHSPGGNLIDHFVAAQHAKKRLTTAPLADSATRLRRVYLDLIGLPPTAEQIERFCKDETHGAYAAVVERLLASPQYGERWGRHWMDVWRYADWSGEVNNQVRGSPQHIWRWRDWIVESLNQDLGYDQMIRQMLAADELAPDDPSQLRATGFLARNWYKFNRNVWLDDTVEHTAKAFLGLTFNCAKCHDHKYDPISQRNYYQLRAFFEPHDIRTDPIQGTSDPKKDGLVRVFDAKLDTPTYLFQRGNENQPQTEAPLSPQLPDVLGGRLTITSIMVQRNNVRIVSSGRRLALADWIASESNPLTARVAVNHIWLRHFGTPLTNGMTDLGMRSPRPEYAELLDTLAAEFMRSGWSMKTLHRLIVLSRTYQMQSGYSTPSNLALDPDNTLLWRMNHRRLEGETIRDSALHLAGNLDLTMGGREIALEDSRTSVRRSLYFRHGHERQTLFLKTFDGASVLECYRRKSTIVPQQALALSNSVVIRSQTRLIARRLSTAADSDGDFIGLAFRHVLGRRASNQETSRCEDFLSSQEALVQRADLTYAENSPTPLGRTADDARLRARQGLVHVLINHNDFVTSR